MAVTVDNAGINRTGNSDTATYVSSATLSLTVASGASGLAVGVGVGKGGTDVSGISIAVTYDGVSMTTKKRQAPGSNTAVVEVFWLDSPNSGTHNVSVTLSGGNTPAAITIGAVSFFGSSGMANATSTFGNVGNSPTLAITSATNNLTFGFATHGSTITASNNTSQGIQNGDPASAGGCAAVATGTGASTTNMSWTSAVSDHWTLVGFSVTAIVDLNISVTPSTAYNNKPMIVIA